MHKEIKIIYTDSAREEIIEIFNELGIDKYVNLEGIQAMWAKNVRHLNSKIWPGTDSLMFIILEEELAEKLIEKLRILKKNLMDGVALFVLVSPVEIIF